MTISETKVNIASYCEHILLGKINRYTGKMIKFAHVCTRNHGNVNMQSKYMKLIYIVKIYFVTPCQTTAQGPFD